MSAVIGEGAECATECRQGPDSSGAPGSTHLRFSNRQSVRVESSLTRSKQRTANRSNRQLFGVVFLAIVLGAPSFRLAAQTKNDDAGVVACRVLEAHASTHPAVIVVVFHQRDKADQARLASLLRNLTGESVELQASDGKWVSATVARLKSCFGRGLLLLPADGPPLKDGSTFVLQFSPVAKGN
jgi:hypothetical protein